MIDDMMINRYKNEIRQLDGKITVLKIENAALKQRERDLQTAATLWEKNYNYLLTLIEDPKNDRLD